MYIVGFKSGFMEGVGHFHMRVDTLLAQNGHLGARQVNKGRCHIIHHTGRHMHLQTLVLGCACQRMLGIGACGVVTLLANAPAHTVPELVQV